MALQKKTKPEHGQNNLINPPARKVEWGPGRKLISFATAMVLGQSRGDLVPFCQVSFRGKAPRAAKTLLRPSQSRWRRSKKRGFQRLKRGRGETKDYTKAKNKKNKPQGGGGRPPPDGCSIKNPKGGPKPVMPLDDETVGKGAPGKAEKKKPGGRRSV